MNKMNEEQAKKELESRYEKAEKLLENNEKTEEFLQKLEKKLQDIPKVGEILSIIPSLISLIRSYIKKEYTNIPIGTIIAIVSALMYFLSPIDFVSDAIPGIGYIDDVFVITTCLKLVGDDVEEYKKWREKIINR